MSDAGGFASPGGGGPSGGPPVLHAGVRTPELCWLLCNEGKAEELAANLVTRILDALRGPKGPLQLKKKREKQQEELLDPLHST